jgi:protein O-GlcNAc transferase
VGVLSLGTVESVDQSHVLTKFPPSFTYYRPNTGRTTDKDRRASRRRVPLVVCGRLWQTAEFGMNDRDQAKDLFFKGLEGLGNRDFSYAEEMFLETLNLAPKSVPTLNNLAIAQYEQGKTNDASLTARKVLEFDPNNVDAYLMLSTCQKDQKLFDEVIKICQKIISIDPTIVEAHCNLGYALNKTQRYKEAIASLDCAIELNSKNADGFLNRGNALKNVKRHGEALVAYDKALTLKPELVEAWLGRGNVFAGLKQYDDALAAYDKALALKPDLDEAWLSRGNVFAELKRYDEALAALDKALALKPDLENAWLSRGNVFYYLKRYNETFAAYDKALTLKPDFAEAWHSRGNVFYSLKRYDEALAAYDKALALKPDLAESWFGRGNVFNNLKKHDEAALAYGKVLEIEPKYPFAKGFLLHQKMLTCDWQGIERHEVECDIMSDHLSAEPFCWQGIATSERSLELCARLYNESEFPANIKQIGKVTFDSKRKIRIAYLSGEFREQATSHLLVGVLENHDHSQFEIFAFDNGWDDQSDIRYRINTSVDKIFDISRLSDSSAAALIGDNQIDILINLNGYFGWHRMGVFAQRSAPIQVNYLGFPGTLGARYIDYIVADPHVIPEDHQSFYKEKVAYLPNCYQANDNKKTIGSHVFTRQECELPDRGFVFCCFNNNYKIVPEIFDLWMQILLKLGDSVLWLFEDNQSSATNLRKEAATRGVNPERLIFARRIPLQDHLARHRLADLFLDTLPYNAHTTASDALWAGLPVLTQIGETFAGRVAASLLTAIGLPELITRSPQAYVDLAVELATNPEKLAGIRSKLVGNRLTTPLFNTQLFTRHLEASYRAMYERYQAGLPPDHIYVSQ